MIRVLVADDHAIVRKGMIQILMDAQELFDVEEADSGQQVIDMLQKSDYDVVVLDISMPGRSGLETLILIKAENPEQRVLMLSMHPEEQYAMRVLKAGASGYLMKESAPNDLIEAVQKVAQGHKYITPSLAEALANSFDRDSEGMPHEKLSDREFEVLILIAKGKAVKEIADELFLSTKTVHTYRSRIMEKMDLKGTAELIHYTLQNHLIE